MYDRDRLYKQCRINENEYVIPIESELIQVFEQDPELEQAGPASIDEINETDWGRLRVSEAYRPYVLSAKYRGTGE